MAILPTNLPLQMPEAPKPTKSWSPYQQAIFDAIVRGQGNGVVEAVAGSGKTTTMVEAIKQWKDVNPSGSAIFVAFNKSIANELQERVPAGVDASTLHSVCYKAIGRRFKGCRVDDKKLFDVIDAVTEQCGYSKESRDWDNKAMAYAISEDLNRVYGLLKSTMTNLEDAGAVSDVLADYSLLLKAPMQSIPMLPALDKAMRADTTRISFDEMLSFMVDCCIMPVQTYDLVCVDESQDMNLLQIEILKRLVSPEGKLWAVGDSRQAIYRFRGADNGAMDRIRSEFNVAEQNQLPLSITYRCPKAVVARAQAIVEHLRAPDHAEQGTVLDNAASAWRKTLLSLTDGDSMVVCRSNAPLVTAVLLLIRHGRKAVIKGRDVGKSLLKLAKDIGRRNGGSIVAFVTALEKYRNKEASKLDAKRQANQIQALHDRCDTMLVLLDSVDHPHELEARIEAIFSDNLGTGIVCSTIHKAKGLESPTVVFLKPEIIDFIASKCAEKDDVAGVTQEENLKYVAITRAQKTLIYQPLPRKGDEDENGGDE